MNHINLPSFFSFFLVMILVIVYHLKCEARDSINMSNPLINSSDTLVSAGKRFELGFFTPEGNDKGNRYVGIWYYKLKPRTIVWVANRDSPLRDSCGVFGIADDGNLRAWCSKVEGVSITSLKNSTTFNRTLQLLDTGNLIFADGQSGTTLWQSFDHPTDTFLPSMQRKDNVELTSWISPSDPRRGAYTFLREQGTYSIQNGSDVYWKIGEPGMFMTDDLLPFSVDQILSYFDRGFAQKNNQSLVKKRSKKNIPLPNNTRAFYNDSRIVMNHTGEIQCYIYISVDGGRWFLLWSEPKNPCHLYGKCGKFAICNMENVPVCQCLRGFEPASLEDWGAGQYSEGCHRESKKCSPEDRFLNLSLVKVRGSVTKFDQAHDEAECKDGCLKNCKCKAYLFTRVSDRETGDSAAKCWIWSDLEDLHQKYSSSRVLHLLLRLPYVDIAVSKSRICQPCVNNLIPYPLSTGPDCGDPLYDSFYCNNAIGEINFKTLSGEYQVAGINKEKHRFVILVDSESADTCNSRNLSSQVLKLNQSLPFKVTNWCYNDSSNSSPWPEVRLGNKIEIGWEPPLEPTCESSTDCIDWPNSDCRDKGKGQKRCYCNRSYQWDNSNATCTEDLEAHKNKSQERNWFAFTIVVAGVIVVSCSGYILYQRRSMAERLGHRGNTEASPVLFSYGSERQISDLMHENNKRIDVPFYNLEDILCATDNFSDAKKLGQGGFGPVYKGTFPGGHEIAVKRLSSCSGQGIEEFLNEVVLIAKLQHRNLVRLLGYCIKGNEKILLYEYMPNRSLEAYIFDQHKRLLLDWEKRFEIILGIARGLLYLHQDSRLRIIHRDLKTSNILLDEEMNPKISDFGLARIVEGKGTEASTNKVVGTYGYMSPEYAMDGKFSIKSDVFSFGVVMLEIVSGKKNTGFYNPHEVLNLLGYAWRLWCDNKAIDLVDPTLFESCEKSQVIKCINIGLLCVQEDPNNRPSMSTVILMLGSETTPLPLPSQPAFVVRRRLSSTASSSSSKPDMISNNELTISLAQGR